MLGPSQRAFEVFCYRDSAVAGLIPGCKRWLSELDLRGTQPDVSFPRQLWGVGKSRAERVRGHWPRGLGCVCMESQSKVIPC